MLRIPIPITMGKGFILLWALSSDRMANVIEWSSTWQYLNNTVTVILWDEDLQQLP